MDAPNTSTHKHPATKYTQAIPANVTPETRAILRELGVAHPEAIPTRQASAYLSQIKGVPTAASTLEVLRCQSRGPKYKKIGSRVFYSLQWLDEYAQGVEVRIYDPSCS